MKKEMVSIWISKELKEYIASICPKNKTYSQFLEEAIAYYITHTTPQQPSPLNPKPNTKPNLKEVEK